MKANRSRRLSASALSVGTGWNGQRAMHEQDELNQAILYALKTGALFPVPDPKPGATTDDLIQWGAMRNLHTKIRAFDVAGGFSTSAP
jgi:hypothetical protein